LHHCSLAKLEELPGGRHVGWGLCCILNDSWTLVSETLMSLKSTTVRGGWRYWPITPRGALCLSQTARKSQCTIVRTIVYRFSYLLGIFNALGNASASRIHGYYLGGEAVFRPFALLAVLSPSQYSLRAAIFRSCADTRRSGLCGLP